jgi:beta-xylosidase
LSSPLTITNTHTHTTTTYYYHDSVMSFIYMYSYLRQSNSYRESNEYWSKYHMKKSH